jgi:quercetin dioxygenase-like cupin family protein
MSVPQIMNQRLSRIATVTALSALWCCANAADAPDASSPKCVDITDAPLIALTPDKVPWIDHNVVPNVKWKDAKHEPARTALLEGNPQSDGVRALILSYPSGISSGPHKHPTAERAYVISGSVFMVVGNGGDKDAVRYRAGSYYTVPANTRHYMWTDESTSVFVVQGGPYKAILLPDTDAGKSK